MKLLKMIFGICDTGGPSDEGCWSVSDHQIVVGMNRAKEILTPGGAVRLEGKGLSGKILLFHGLDGKFYAVKNKCTHIGGRRIDPTIEHDRLKCCSVMGSVFNYKGEVVSGPARKPLVSYPVTTESGRLIISLQKETA
ncbi:MAG: Rieske (2Fe-2S) protein [Proteobacteria bacterium]|nr:Rieske (2Fe-2S) protein [Pseudomonadota bacterium]